MLPSNSNASLLSVPKTAFRVLIALGLAGGFSGHLHAVTSEVISFSSKGNDRLYGVSYDQSGNFYGVGSYADSSDSNTLITKFNADGSRDLSFGTSGYLLLNLMSARDGEVARNVLVDAQGRIIVAGSIEEAGALDARDRDLFVLRLLPDGSPDESFAKQGLAIFNLAPSTSQGGLYLPDTLGGITLDAQGRLILHASQKREGGEDNDFVLLRLTTEGQLDPSFGQGGRISLDFDQLPANPKVPVVLADGSILGTGYTRRDGIVVPVVYKVDASGKLDLSYGKDGIFSEAVLSEVTEIYSVAIQGDSIVTVGYGKNAGDSSLDFLSMRINGQGKLDQTYGTSSGYTRIDAAGFNDNGRNMTVLPDGRLVLIGGGRIAADNAQGMLAVLDPNGIPDKTFGTNGVQLIDFGGSNDFLWGVAVAPNSSHAVAVGIKGVNTPGSSDDAAIVLLDSLLTK